jgi:hypothetical protein
MQNILPAVLSKRRLVPLVAIGALLAASLLLQHAAAIRAAGASVKTVVVAPCAGGRILASPFPFSAPGATVTLSGFSGSCGTPEFRFLLLAPGATTWVFKTAYSATSTYSWNTTGAQPGVWQIGVWIRAVGSTARYQTYGLGTYSLVIPYCTSASISYAETVTTTADLTLFPAATGCTSQLYQWLELIPGSTTWVTAQVYGGTNLHLILSNPKGGYRFVLEAKQTGSSHHYDTYAEITIWWLG